MKVKIKKDRAWELDFLRGLSILLVVFDHVMLDIAYMFGASWKYSGIEGLENAYQTASAYMDSWLRETFWIVFIFIFFFISGCCSSFSRNNFLRALKLAVLACLITLTTYLIEVTLATEGLFIIFGVLHCIAACILIYALLNFLIMLVKPLRNRGIKAGIILAVAAVCLILNSIYNIPIMDISNNASMGSGTFFQGFFVYIDTFSYKSADYFPLLPYLGFFLIGAAAGIIFYPQKKSLLPKLNGKWHYPITFFGKHSLLVYIASQLIIMTILALVTFSKVGEFGL